MYKKAAPLDFAIDDFSMGLDWTNPPANVGLKWLVNAKNVNLSSIKALEKRGGVQIWNVSTQIANAVITALYEYNAPDGNAYILAACDTILYYWAGLPTGWIALKDTLTPNLRYSFAATNGYCFITNGTEDMFKLKNTTAYTTIGIDAPSTAATVALAEVTYTSTTEDHSGTATTLFLNLRKESTYTKLAQTFKIAKESILTSVKFYMAKLNSPTGNIWVELYSDNNGQPGSLLDTSDTYDVSTVSASAALFTFTDFDVLQTLAMDTTYWAILCGDFTINGTDYVRVFRPSTNTYASGYAWSYSGSAWTNRGIDFHFDLIYDVLQDVSGRYKWVYAYRTGSGLISNYSPASEPVIVRSQVATVTCQYSTNTEVTYVVLYRTFDMGDEDSTDYFLVTEVANDSDGGPVEIADDKTDNDLTTKAENNNTIPPLAKYLVVYQDRLIYANCPNETDGHSLFMISKVGSPEAVPSANYHYFDRDDGNEITGAAMLPDYLVIFKKNKIATMTRDFSEWNTISRGIGCIAPWSIITLTDKIVFLSEEGIKATDGKTVYDIGKKLINFTRAGFWREAYSDDYTGIYYPEKKQFYINLYNNAMTLVGHWLASLYMDITPEFAQDDNYVGWTWHEYPNQDFYTFGTYTDPNGITRIIAGTSNGYVYQLDLGYDDDGEDIDIAIETGALTLNTPLGLDKTVRSLNVTYSANNETSTGSGTVKLYVDIDFVHASDYVTLTSLGAGYEEYGYSTALYLGPGKMTTENLDVVSSCTGKRFSFRLEDSSKNQFTLFSIQPFYRIEGIR